MRLFVAFEVPDEAQRAIDEAIAPLRDRFPKARWVPTENRHVTVKFLGPTWPRLRGWVDERLGDVASKTASVPTRLASLGAFPGGRHARVLWVGVDDAEGRLAVLAAAIDEALAGEFAAEARAYAPHCTVARSDPPVHLDDRDLDRELRAVPFTVDRLVLFRSHLRRPAPRYEKLARYPLPRP